MEQRFTSNQRVQPVLVVDLYRIDTSKLEALRAAVNTIKRCARVCAEHISFFDMRCADFVLDYDINKKLDTLLPC